jgi:dTDP-4-dehydrorhamnose 3,5-epimerase|tara:strand:- start:60 stop:623 length:564 start_codon:yes stop_codon:yes gene_type:complete
LSEIKIKKTTFQDLFVLERIAHRDSRGCFSRMFCRFSLKHIIDKKRICQINHSITQKKGCVRGLHFQHYPNAETKIVTCLKGEVYDVAVDLREGSSTFLQHHSIVLSEDNCLSVSIPEGFAHGFQTLSQNCELLYLHTADYKPEAEGGINALDPKFELDWPLQFSDRSEKDRKIPILTDDFKGIRIP